MRHENEGRVWFITGAGRGFGREFALSALDRGDRVAATARDPAALDDLVARYGPSVLPLSLDVTDRSAVFEAISKADANFGRLDVIVNNAGYGLFGAVEELDPDQLRAQFETNVIGVLHVTQAALPVLRAQGSGHLIQISSTGGIGAFPTLGGYNASKWALEALSDALSQEIAGTGIHVTIVEPSGFATDWSGTSAVRSEPMPQYDAAREQMDAYHRETTPGDLSAAGRAILKIVDAEDPPLRVLLGADLIEFVGQLYEDRLSTWREWQEVTEAAAGTVGPEQQLREAWAQFSAAMEENDADRLGELLGEEFALGHMTGYRQPRREWLAEIAAGSTSYHRVSTEELTVELEDVDTAVVTARTFTDVTIAGDRGNWPMTLRIDFHQHDSRWIAVRADGSAW